MNKSEIAAIFQKIWCKETSAFPDTWTPDNPAHGQCLSTSRIAKIHLGGNIVLAEVSPDKNLHFYNVLANGSAEDFTSSQLCKSTILCPRRFVSDSELDEWGLIFPEIARRYQLLLMKFEAEI